MGYLIIEHVERGQGSSTELHRFETLEKAYEYIKQSGNLLLHLKLYKINEVYIDLEKLDSMPSKSNMAE